MNDFWRSWWAFGFMVTPFVIGLSGLAVLAYTTYRHYDKVITAFPNSRGVRNFSRLWAGFDFPSRCLQVGSIGGFVLWPNIHIRRGDLDPDEIRNFPSTIKRLMVISASLLLIGSAWLILAVALLKFTKS